MAPPSDSDENSSRSSPQGAFAPVTPIGTVVGDRFELYQQLGEGTVASTYLAVERCGLDLRRLAAVKLLKPEVVGDIARLATMLSNARCLATKSSPYLVSVRGASVDDGGPGETGPFIASDYVFGESLLTILARCTQLERPPPTPIALRIAADACAGLAELHSGACDQSLQHHALRPANLLVSYGGHACLADAGISSTPAQLLGDAALSVGLAQFIAPELLPEAQLFGDPLGPTTDIYALGAALYVLVTLRFPFDDKQLGELIASKQQTGAIPARKRRTTVPRDLEALLARTLSPMAEQRHQSADELADELRFLIAESDERADHRTVARWLAELFAEQLPSKQRVLRGLLWPDRPEAAAPSASSGRGGERTKPVMVPSEPTPEQALPTTKLEELEDEGDTRVGGPLGPDGPSGMPSVEHVSFGRAIPTEEVSTGRLPGRQRPDSDVIQTKVETLGGSAPLDEPPPPDEGDTAVTALQQVFSDSETIRRERAPAGAQRSDSALTPPPVAEAGATPEPEPAFGREPEQPEGDTVRAAKPAREWSASTDMTTVPFDDAEEKTDVGQLPASPDDGVESSR